MYLQKHIFKYFSLLLNRTFLSECHVVLQKYKNEAIFITQRNFFIVTFSLHFI